MRLIVLGPQGAGKGTQGKRIADKFGIVSIATGDIFRWAISSGTDLGQKVKQYVESGRLVPNDLTIEVVRERLAADDAANGFLIDGFPRTIEQAAALDEILEARGVSLDAALVLEVPEDVSLRRITGRRVCINCGRNYHVDSPPERDWTCDTCGGEVGRRFDDEGEEMVRERLRLYHEQTEPLKQHYAERGLLRAVDGEGGVNEVFDRIVALL
ncbi:MAG TPA: adenylate kinase [Actinomycetota bacterium]|nr:adenylate kinase [Actinomycetota bacterium]